MSDRHPESHGLKIADLPSSAEALLIEELRLLNLNEVDERDLDEVISIALRDLVTHGEQTLPPEVLQRIA